MTLCLDSIRNCLEGFVPAVVATCDAGGLPNISMISQVHYVDPDRVALSYQFFNKTRRNLLATRSASVEVVDPVSCARFRLDLDYEETRTSGPLFEAMKAKLAGIASQSGMEGVFRLLGSDVFRVRALSALDVPTLASPPARQHLTSVRRAHARMSAAPDLDGLLDITLESLRKDFGIEHALIMMLEQQSDCLFTVASRGYPTSGIGSEIALGEGVIGVAAREGVPIRIGKMTSEYDYGAAIRQSAHRSGQDWAAATEIGFPGLAHPESQLALPMQCRGRTIGVLFVESDQPMRFWYDDEDALALVADHLGALITAIPRDEVPAETRRAVAATSARVVTVRYYPFDDSVFFDNDYVIKGVAGAIFWRIVSEHVATGRSEFTNRELRLDLACRLPAHAENLEARLVLLRRRLEERGDCIRLERCGRGRFCLVAGCRFELQEIGAGRSPAA